MCRHPVRGHAISVLNHCLSGISSLTLTYTTPDSGLTYTYQSPVFHIPWCPLIVVTLLATSCVCSVDTLCYVAYQLSPQQTGTEDVTAGQLILKCLTLKSHCAHYPFKCKRLTEESQGTELTRTIDSVSGE